MVALDRVGAISRRIYDRFCAIDDDWQGVFVGLVVVVAISLLGVPVP